MVSLLQNNALSAVGSKAQHGDVLQEEEEPSSWDCEIEKTSTHRAFFSKSAGYSLFRCCFP